jgi:polysaccharide biosynthesis/export protein
VYRKSLLVLAFGLCFGALNLSAADLTTNQSTALAGPTKAPTNSAAAILSMDLLDNQRKLGVGDIVSYRVIEDREDAKQLRVAESGELDIPYLGRFAASNKTCRGLAEALKSELERDLYYTATVIVALDLQNREREKEPLGKVWVIGQVRQPGSQNIPRDEPFTVSNAILAAGGFGDFANRKKVKLTRKRPGQKDATYTIDVTDIWENGKSQYDLKVEPGDSIFVPQRLINF